MVPGRRFFYRRQALGLAVVFSRRCTRAHEFMVIPKRLLFSVVLSLVLLAGCALATHRGEAADAAARCKGTSLPAGAAQAQAQAQPLALGDTLHQIRAAEEVNAVMVTQHQLPAWQAGTYVVDVTLQVGTRVHMVVDRRAHDAMVCGHLGFAGQWATLEQVPDQAFARNALAISTAFKNDVGFVVELEIVKPTAAQVGLVGPLGAAAGGALQVKFAFEQRQGAAHFGLVSQRALP